MQKVKFALKFAEGKLYAFLSAQMPVVHTAWQVAVPALLSGLLVAHSSADVKAAFVAAGAVFLAALKASYLKARG